MRLGLPTRPSRPSKQRCSPAHEALTQQGFAKPPLADSATQAGACPPVGWGMACSAATRAWCCLTCRCRACKVCEACASRSWACHQVDQAGPETCQLKPKLINSVKTLSKTACADKGHACKTRQWLRHWGHHAFQNCHWGFMSLPPQVRAKSARRYLSATSDLEGSATICGSIQWAGRAPARRGLATVFAKAVHVANAGREPASAIDPRAIRHV